MIFQNVAVIMVLSLFFSSSVVGYPFGSVNQCRYALPQSVLNTPSQLSINMEPNFATFENSTFDIKINHPALESITFSNPKLCERIIQYTY
jgi:hypothetical protein